MTHEFKSLIEGYLSAKEIGLQAVLATVVDLDGSSYRRPGVRMMITENGHMTGAVSGGCVEKEILKQASSVFITGNAKMMTYDGRYRLGCEGVLYILIEKLSPTPEMINDFKKCIQDRKPFQIESIYSNKIGVNSEIGSVISFSNNKKYSFCESKELTKERNTNYKTFTQVMSPCFRLIIVGAEHDAAQLCLSANNLGWEVQIVTSPSDPQTKEDFPGVHTIHPVNPEDFNISQIDKNSAIVLMTHNYAKDLRFLLALKEVQPAYLGLLGPLKRREKLLNDFMDLNPLIDDSFFDMVYGPVGLNIGAETPQEISLSICSEILAVIRKEEPKPLKDKTGTIHHHVSFLKNE
ncbi:MAG TPA: XdhC/CoxI family protein [Bacteroidetes bacterium]|nr:XdhC/CoxI family protein [Bacteroidota bacterium]